MIISFKWYRESPSIWFRYRIFPIGTYITNRIHYTTTKDPPMYLHTAPCEPIIWASPQQCKSTLPPVYPCSLYTPAGSSLRGESVDRRPNIVCSLIILQWDRSNRPPKANKLTTSLSRSTTLGSRRSRPLPTKITKNCKYQFPSLMRNKSKTGLSNTNPLNLKTASCSLSPPSSKEPKCAALMDFAMYKNIYIDQLLKLSFPSQR